MSEIKVEDRSIFFFNKSSATFIADEELWTKDETSRYTSYICNICGRRCVSRNDMKRHVRVHTGERPYVCEHCGRAFKIKHHLKDHVRVHLKDLM